MPQQLRILIGDDEKDAVATLLELLRGEGHEVRGVYSGRAVLDMVRDFGPDVVLLDIGMPLVSGYEVARTLRERYASARPLLVAVTGRDDVGGRARAALAGVAQHVAKPYEPAALLALLASAGARQAPAGRGTAGPAAPDDRPANR
jgi:CheY-like chemotaxis protein